MQSPELWVDFGNGTGFYHRGFYGVTRGRKDVSGVLAYDGPRCVGTGCCEFTRKLAGREGL